MWKFAKMSMLAISLSSSLVLIPKLVDASELGAHTLGSKQTDLGDSGADLACLIMGAFSPSTGACLDKKWNYDRWLETKKKPSEKTGGDGNDVVSNSNPDVQTNSGSEEPQAASVDTFVADPSSVQRANEDSSSDENTSKNPSEEDKVQEEAVEPKEEDQEVETDDEKEQPRINLTRDDPAKDGEEVFVVTDTDPNEPDPRITRDDPAKDGEEVFVITDTDPNEPDPRITRDDPAKDGEEVFVITDTDPNEPDPRITRDDPAKDGEEVFVVTDTDPNEPDPRVTNPTRSYGRGGGSSFPSFQLGGGSGGLSKKLLMLDLRKMMSVDYRGRGGLL